MRASRCHDAEVIAAYPGSFDPLHLGHLSVIERVAGQFEQLVVLVLANPAKTHLLSVERRVELVAASTDHLGNVRAIGHVGLTVDGARAVGAGVLVRNAGKEQRVEVTMAVTNQAISGPPTVLVPPDPNTATISSTFVRELVRHRRYDDIAPLVPEPVHLALSGL